MGNQGGKSVQEAVAHEGSAGTVSAHAHACMRRERPHANCFLQEAAAHAPLAIGLYINSV